MLNSRKAVSPGFALCHRTPSPPGIGTELNAYQELPHTPRIGRFAFVSACGSKETRGPTPLDLPPPVGGSVRRRRRDEIILTRYDAGYTIAA